MRRVAIFGGSFNPVHWGHLLIAEAALSQFALDEVVWLPTQAPPHKSTLMSTFHHRLTLVRLAIADHPAFSVSDIEAQQLGLSYASVTLQHLQHLHPNTCWFWVLGVDAFQTLPQWRGRRELAEQCTWIVAPRDASLADGVPRPLATEERCQRVVDQMSRESIAIHWSLLHLPIIGISSSLIRQRCQLKQSIRYWVPESVRDYILIHKLY